MLGEDPEARADAVEPGLVPELEPPFGRGVNFQLEVEDVAAIHEAVMARAQPLVVGLEERWYLVDDHEEGNRQFVVEDPDGYLWRPFQDLGDRPA